MRYTPEASIKISEFISSLVCALVFCGALLMAPIAHAENETIKAMQYEPPVGEEPVVETAPPLRGFSVSGVLGYIDYVEPTVMHELGLMYGVNVGYTNVNEWQAIVYHFEADYMTGFLTYDGGNTTTRFQARAKDWILNLRGTFGLIRDFADASTIVPYVGLGYRTLNDKIEGSGSYLRRITYLYIPIGFSYSRAINATDSISFQADYDYVVSGNVFSKLSDVNPSYPDLVMSNNGFGFYVAVDFFRRLPSVGVQITPYFQKWKMKDSTIDYGFIEPANSSDFIGAKVGVDF